MSNPITVMEEKPIQLEIIVKEVLVTIMIRTFFKVFSQIVLFFSSLQRNKSDRILHFKQSF